MRAADTAARALAATERLAQRPAGAIVAGLAALAVYAVRALAWPLGIGRDLDEYVLAYLQLLDLDPVLPWSLLFRTPVTPVVAGPLLDVAGGALAEPAMAVLYAVSIVAWFLAAATFGPRVAIAVAIVLLLYPGFGAIFHVVSSEPVSATGFALWALAVARAARAPTPGRWALVGLATALVTLTRPGDVVLAPIALLALAAPLAWSRRLRLAAVTVAATLVPLAGWVVHNGLVLDEWTLARGGNAVLPFYRALLEDRIVSPEHGDASRRLARAVESSLVTREPYRSYGVTTEDIFTRATARVHEDMYLLSDEVFGWDTDYRVLRDAALEGIAAEPGTYARGVARTIWIQLTEPYYVGVGADPVTPEPPADESDGGSLPPPSEGQLIPGGQNLWISRPDNAIRQVWTSPTTFRFAFSDPSLRPRFDELERRRDELLDAFPDRAPREGLARRLDQLSRWSPRPLMWIALGVAALLWRRPRGWPTLVAIALGALAVVSLNALGLLADRDFLLPVFPAFVLFGLGALLATRDPTPS